MSHPLLLVPTTFERDHWVRAHPIDADHIRVIGFGPVAAAARTARCLALESPPRVTLVGIAGSYDPDRWAVGAATTFDQVVLGEIGAGRGAERIGLSELGFAQVAEESGAPKIEERLDVGAGVPSPTTSSRGSVLLTVLSASGDRDHAADRRRCYPDAAAEDMEAFGVALACADAGVPLTIIRGMSNVAGERDKALWKIDDALAAAAAVLISRKGLTP